MRRTKIYIQAAEQISIQQPLSQQWMADPLIHHELFVQALNPSFGDYIAPKDARRMGNLIKRALVTALKVLKDTGIEHPDAFITGTSIGSLTYTDRFIQEMVENDEQALSPTYFMQSTHNTVGSTLAIYTKSHGYNITYSHGSCSFDKALLDAWMQMNLGKINTALVSGFDEMSESYFELLKKTERVGIDGMVPCGEVSMSMMLNTSNKAGCLCELAGISTGCFTSLEEVKKQVEDMLAGADMGIDDVNLVMTGKNGNPENDQCYSETLQSIMPNVPQLHYKHIFGENFTSSALGVYAASHCLSQGCVPHFLYEDPCQSSPNEKINNIILFNQMNGQEYTFVLLKAI